mgnify:CR=1 FL=1
MAEKVVISGADAVAEAVKLCKAKVLPMYPITPSTVIPERISELIANGEMDANMIYVESEHSAISALFGAYATGVRGFTATASQGLALMHEILPIMASMRFPAVMLVANRALSGPINIWNDHSDSMSERDQGWLQLYCENNQEAFDTIIMAYKIAESNEVSLPIMVCMDGYYLTHSYEAITIEEQEKVSEFLPPYSPQNYLDTKKPMSFGPIAYPNVYFEFKEEQEKGMQKAIEIIPKVQQEFKKKFGRNYGDGLIETYRLEDADYALLCTGSINGTARVVIDEMRREGKKVGLIKLIAVRPLPVERLKKVSKKLKAIAVIDRHASIGFGGALSNDIKATMTKEKTTIAGFMAGLGGRDVDRGRLRKALETVMNGKEGYWLK